MDELQMYVIDVAREKMNPQEPTSIIPPVINVKILIQMLEDISNKVDTISKIDTKKNSIVETHVTIKE